MTSTNRHGDSRRTLAIFRRFAGGERTRFVGALVLMLVEAVTVIAVPKLIGSVVTLLKDDHAPILFGLRAPRGAGIAVLAVAIVVVTATSSAAESLCDVSLAKTGRALGYNVRAALYAHLQRLSLAYHLRRSTGDVLTRITNDVQVLEEFVVESVKDLLGSALLLVGSVAFLFSQSWRIALLAVAIVPALAAVSSFFARRIKASTKTLRAREGDLASTAQEMLTTISLVQTYGRARQEQEKFARESSSAKDAILRTARLEAVFGFTVAILEAAVIALVILFGARLVRSDSISAGDLVTFILLIQGMFKPTRRIIKEWNSVAKVYASVERVAEVLEREPAVQDLPAAAEAPLLTGAMEFRDVSFAYQPQVDQGGAGEDDEDGESTRLTLRSVSFTVDPGEAVALVGHSGAGKSTIAQLLPRLYDPQAGAVLLDGHDIRQFTIDSLRAQISMVLQETILLRGTVAENIAYGRDGATMRDVVRAAVQAQADDFIRTLPQGYDTVLGERAGTLSGGQRQRLAIARAFIRDTPILILDEPTTGLDAKASAGVAEALSTLLQGRSALIVSHDLNLIRGVDRIIVLSGGRVLEEGTPADLLAGGGLYAELYASQFGVAMAEAAPGGAEPVGPVERLERLEPAAPVELHREAAVLAVGRGPAREDEVTRAAFDASLLDAVPRPASPQEYQELTGWRRPVPSVVRPVHPELDPLRTPALSARLPGLGEAVDAAAVARHLGRMLREGWVLQSCVVDKVVLDLPHGATVRYRAAVRSERSSADQEVLVGGRVFASADRAVEYGDRAAALARSAPRLGRLGPFGDAVHVLPRAGLVLHAFPVDPELPGLLVAADEELARAVLEPVLPKAASGLEMAGLRTEVVKHTVGRQAVLRYELWWRVQPSGRTLRQVAYGKVFDDDRGGAVGPTVAALQRSLGGVDGMGLRAQPFLLPRVLGYLPDSRLLVSEALPGSPRLPGLVRAHAQGQAAAEQGAPEALRGLARVAAALHRPVPGAVDPREVGASRPRTLSGEVDRLAAGTETLAQVAPELAGTLASHLASLRSAAAGSSGLPPVLAHGDLTPSEVLLDGPIHSLFDLDSACVAEPALDLGHLTAHLALAARRALGLDGSRGAPLVRELQQGFLADYAAARPDLDGEALARRVDLYHAAFLADLALRSWLQLKPDRVALALDLLDEAAAGSRRPAAQTRTNADRRGRHALTGD
ncbi:ABC transporter transmembrane domain-containing protein [Pedococcus sp. 2YAF34]|uniref:ABC transporter transmembrane domain-containing protein n=1 Tax=Pedococcus sp. 2YAF34 TaxID=3233032 RepID=UPI003F971CE4